MNTKNLSIVIEDDFGIMVCNEEILKNGLMVSMAFIGIMRGMFGVTSGIVDAGGDMSVWSDIKPWVIGIQDPYNEDEIVARLLVRNAGIATSNTSYRSWSMGDVQYHHILHGHTGNSAESDIIQATAFASSATEAEVAAKVLCILGTDQVGSWFNQHFPTLGFILIRQDGEVIINRNLLNYAIIMEE
ncbi:MAG: FAD:protein FMN transferase [Paenibacillaceae bacterium]